MFDILLGPKFSNKCKHSVKCIKCRVETIRKKRHAIERCLRKDVADLISIGHDANAFGRMDALLFEINQISCYDMIDKYCCCILEHLPTMQKERECPKETMEAVATLIFAAARFSDLPELANLRHGFIERYRTTMELYTNREFVEKLQKKCFLQNEKLRLMNDISKEFNIDWDVKSLEYKLSNPLAKTIEDCPTVHFPFSNKNYIESQIIDERREITDRKDEGVNGRKTVLQKTDGGRELTDRRNELFNGRKPVLEKTEGNTYPASVVQKQQIEFENPKPVNNHHEQKNIQMKGDERHSRSAVQKHQVQTEHRNIPTTPKYANSHPHDSIENIKKLAADESKNVAPHYFSRMPPPYVKTIVSQDGDPHKRSEVHEGPDLVCIERRGATRNDKAINTFLPETKFTEDFNGTNSYHDGFLHSTADIVKEMKDNGQQRQPNAVMNPESKRSSNLKPPYLKPNVKNPLENGYLKPTSYEMYGRSDNGDYRKNTAFSVRRKHLEPGTAHARSTCEADAVMKNNTINMDLNDQQGVYWQCKQTDDDVIDGAVYHSHRSHRTYIEQTIHGRRSTNTTYDGGCDNEEENGDKLSQHYSKKGKSGKARTGTSEPKKKSIFDSSRVPEKIIKDEQYLKLSGHTPARTASLPPTDTHVGRHVRSGSLQPDLLSTNGDRSHPRLPDYDDLAARIAALRKLS